ncbi:ribonuclease domain-containing protein [Mycobacterium sp. Aquia_216]|uniref:ribonuclease domain-containing protein n=1 Tax=Mycobacterium sp. Aquia_216 TaxID=2991729 RepID=UPI003FA3AA2B
MWEGVAAEAAQGRAFADLVQVRGLADVLHESAAIARRGADTLDSAKRSVLDAVEEASSAGYVVGEDLSVTPPRGGVAAQAQAQAQAQVYVASIQDRAAQLIAHDQAIAAKITTASAPLNRVTFAEPQAPPVARALDAGFKLDKEWDPYTDQPAHGPFEPVTPAPPQYDPKTGTVQGGGGGGGPIGGKGDLGAGGGAQPLIPKNARDVLQQVDAGKWPGSANAPGTKGGSAFENTPPPGRPPLLPVTDASGKPITYQEWDVNPKVPGQGRDEERIITGSDGSAWYTNDHYGTFHRMR